jgi:hypothetical protein
LLQQLATCIDRGLKHVSKSLRWVRKHVLCVQRLAATLEPAAGDAITRRAAFEQLRQEFAAQRKNPTLQHMAKVMASFAAGLFVGDAPLLVRDNLDLERWFRVSKGHERRIHGRRHTGVRPVQEGPTLMPTLDVHRDMPRPLTANDLLPYCRASAPPSEEQAMQRRKLMRRARSTKKRPALLADLEKRFRDSS